MSSDIPFVYRRDVALQAAKCALDRVFRRVGFPADESYRILYDSYMINLGTMVDYARRKKIGPYAYIMSISDLLIQDKLQNERR